jgi:hydroxyacylglutathione hydrolase
LQTERDINTFFRLDQASIKAQLRVDFPDLPADINAETVFTKLRELRNRW